MNEEINAELVLKSSPAEVKGFLSILDAAHNIESVRRFCRSMYDGYLALERYMDCGHEIDRELDNLKSTLFIASKVVLALEEEEIK